MVGMKQVELLEITKHKVHLLAFKKEFITLLDTWLAEFELGYSSSEILKNNYYEHLVSGQYDTTFYIAQYYQALHWINLGLSQTNVMLIVSHFRKMFIHGSESVDSYNLSKGLCHALDIGSSVVSTIYDMVEKVERMRVNSEREIARIQKTYSLISAEISPLLLQAYIDHQKWKLEMFDLSLGSTITNQYYEVSHEKCKLAQWLIKGGTSYLPKENLKRFMDAHELIHRLGGQAISAAEKDSPEQILKNLSKMEIASDIVGQELLDIIESEFIKIATEDTLTSLPNRRAFDLEFEGNVAFSKRHGFRVGLILLDIDFFKKVNDVYGHLIGDKVLQEIAIILKKTIRKEEKAYRWGGEEFALVSVGIKKYEVKSLAERVRKAIEEHEFCKSSKNSFKITASCGALSFFPDENYLKHEIFARADKLLYLAKESGRNQVQYKVFEEKK